MARHLIRFVALAALALCVSAPAFAQATYPTVSGSRVNGVVPLACDTTGANCAPAASLPTIDTPSGAAASGLVPSATAALNSAQVVKASAGTLYGFSANSTVNGFFMLFNATAAPGDGAVTPVKCYPYVANTPFGAGFYPPLFLSTGITVVFSTTGCFSKTASATAFISGDAK